MAQTQLRSVTPCPHVNLASEMVIAYFAHLNCCSALLAVSVSSVVRVAAVRQSYGTITCPIYIAIQKTAVICCVLEAFLVLICFLPVYSSRHITKMVSFFHTKYPQHVANQAVWKQTGYQRLRTNPETMILLMRAEAM
jgi:hypothetical protein